jgi:hypothetical protein
VPGDGDAAAGDYAEADDGRRSRTPLTIGLVVLALALLAAAFFIQRSDDDGSEEASTTSTTEEEPDDDERRPTSTSTSSSTTAASGPGGAPSPGGVAPPAGGTNSGGGAAPSPPPAPSGPPPVITSFTTPENIDCHNGMDQMFTASWTTTNAAQATISIDGSLFGTFPASSTESLPFNCHSPHTYTLTAHGHDGQTAHQNITLHPRNVPGAAPEDDPLDQ